MQKLESSVVEQNKLGRWVVVDGGLNPFVVDEATKVVSLQTSITITKIKRRKSVNQVVHDEVVLSDSWKRFVAWSNTPPRKHGKFYITSSLLGGLTPALDDRFISVV